MSSITENINNLSESEAKTLLEEIIENSYALIQWPESQMLMEEEWFEYDAILALGSEDKTGSAAYFVPLHRVMK